MLCDTAQWRKTHNFIIKYKKRRSHLHAFAKGFLIKNDFQLQLNAMLPIINMWEQSKGKTNEEKKKKDIFKMNFSIPKANLNIFTHRSLYCVISTWNFVFLYIFHSNLLSLNEKRKVISQFEKGIFNNWREKDDFCKKSNNIKHSLCMIRWLLTQFSCPFEKMSFFCFGFCSSRKMLLLHFNRITIIMDLA